MRIDTPEKQYQVIQVLFAGRSLQTQLCRVPGEEDGYLVAELRDRALSCRLLPLFWNEWKKGGPDFRGCFSREGELFAVFRHREGVALTDRLAASCAPAERLAIARSLFTRLALLDLAPWLQFEVLRDENVLVDDSMTVFFNYDLRQPEIYDTLAPLAVQVRLAGILRRLFADELEKQVSPELAAFLQTLETKPFENSLLLYGAFDAVYDVLRRMQESGGAQPQSLPFRVWERVKKLTRYIRPALAVLAVLAAFCYLLYAVCAGPRNNGGAMVYDKIGTVEVARPGSGPPAGDAG